jgi:hypothetical protein
LKSSKEIKVPKEKEKPGALSRSKFEKVPKRGGTRSSPKSLLGGKEKRKISQASCSQERRVSFFWGELGVMFYIVFVSSLFLTVPRVK